MWDKLFCAESIMNHFGFVNIIWKMKDASFWSVFSLKILFGLEEEDMFVPSQTFSPKDIKQLRKQKLDLFKPHITIHENSVLPRWYSHMIVSLLSFTCLPIWPYHRLAVVVSSSKLLRARKKTHAHCIGIHFYDPPWSLPSQNIRNKVLGKDMFS